MDPSLDELVRRYSELDARHDAAAAHAVQRALLEQDDPTLRRRLVELIEEIENSRISAIVETLLERALAARDSPHALRLWLLGAREGQAQGSLWREAYERALPSSTLRGGALRLASRVREGAALDLVADLLERDPPERPESVDEALAEWFGLPRDTLAMRLPALLPAIAHPSAMGATLDLMNWSTREGVVPRHPASDRVDFLATTLSAIVARLQALVGAVAGEDDAAQRGREIERALALCVSLIDALGLIESERGVDALAEALLVPHRRVQTEAAAALARRGDQRGAKRLTELAVDPAARLRAVKYARELGLEETLPAETVSELATHEAELSTWLAHPRAMGMAPTRLTFAARRRLPWAESEEPVDYVLFRVEYRLGTASYENLAFAAPAPFATSSDLTRLPTLDACALLMGSESQHDAIRERNVDGNELSRWQGALGALFASGATLSRAEFAADFFEERCLVGRFERDGVEGWGVVVAGAPGLAYWSPTSGIVRPLTAREAFAVWKGRKFFEAFGVEDAQNDDSSDAS